MVDRKLFNFLCQTSVHIVLFLQLICLISGNLNIVLRDCIHYSQHHLISVFNYSEQVYCFVFVVANPRVPHWLYSFEIQITWFFHHSCANLYSTPSCFCSNLHPRKILVVNIILTAMCRVLLNILTNICVYIVSYIYLRYLLVELSNLNVLIYLFVHASFFTSTVVMLRNAK